MVLQGSALLGLQPGLQLRAWHAQYRCGGQRGQQTWGDGSIITDQPNPIDTVFFLAQALAQLALHIQMMLTLRIAGTACHADQQPLTFERAQIGLLTLHLHGLHIR